MMKIVDQSECCGCRGCLQICPQNAISVKNDKYGFESINIDENNCINCGLCKKVCPILNIRKNQTHFECGSAYSKDTTIKRSGSSGGLFGVFANQVIKQGGIVYGASFGEQLKLKTTRVDNLDQLGPLFKSKYLLCDTTGAFESIKKDLEGGRQVLYCASPCQLAALKGTLNKDYPNLLCVEFICHGVGSQYQFDQSVKYIETKKEIEIYSYGFREKYKKASSHYYYYDYSYEKAKAKKTGHKRDIYMTFPYYYAYCDRLTCRDICYDCPYATRERVGDITIGDFHIIERYEPEIDRFAGVSMFICNTKKGLDFFKSVSSELVVKLYDKEIIYSNNRFSGKEIPPQKRKRYLAALAEEPYQNVVKVYLSYRKDWRFYYYKLPGFIRKLGIRLLRRT